jgi:hypothetical protein
MNTYAKIATSSGLVGLMNGVAGATDGEREMAGVTKFRESVTLSTYPRPGVSPMPARSFTVTRSNDLAVATSPAMDLKSESLLKADVLLTWDDRTGSHRREFATIICNGGISFAGVSKRAESLVAPPASNPPPSSSPSPSPGPASGPTPPPAFCRHGRPWPHCGQP